MTAARDDSDLPFAVFFRRATGREPYGYQSRLAAGGLPPVVWAPTGSGKTGVLLAWLWHHLHGRTPSPRRLIYALPQSSLVEPVAAQLEQWLANLDLADEVALHVALGREAMSQRQWRLDMQCPAIVVGTADALVSKALNRGYGIGRAIYPIDFALVTNGAHWVIDEAALCPESTTTLRQLAAVTAALGTAEPFGLTCMSATAPPGLLGTVDNPAPSPAQELRIEPGERTGELAQLLDARRIVRRIDAEPGDYQGIAAAAAALHRPGTLTLVVLNTVATARQVHGALPAGAAERTLVHTWFRGQERAALVRKLTGPPGDAGHIVVATQVAEAGLDLDAAVLITEAAPWPSIVLRAGRCNRTGTISDALLCWLPPARHVPYPEQEVTGSAAELDMLEGQQVTGEELLARDVPSTAPPAVTLREADLIGLFGTAPDLGVADLDIAPYVRDTDDLEAQLAWATWDSPGTDRRPPDDARIPLPQWRCRVPLSGVRALMQRDTPVWRLDHRAGGWARVSSEQPARPGEILLVAAADGGYDPISGFDETAAGPVTDCPDLMPDPVAAAEDAPEADEASVEARGWVSLQQHSDETRDWAQELLAVLEPDLPDGAAGAVVAAAYLHDAGKAHPIWQDALCELAPPEIRPDIDAGRPWAKSGGTGWLRFVGDVAFRHELASLLLVDGPLRGLLSGVADVDLARYLILAHHGKLRVHVRDSDPDSQRIMLGLEQDATWPIPPLFGLPATDLAVDLDQFTTSGGHSWSRHVLALRDRYGPFLLAYLETVVRIADWRASARIKLNQH